MPSVPWQAAFGCITTTFSTRGWRGLGLKPSVAYVLLLRPVFPGFVHGKAIQGAHSEMLRAKGGLCPLLNLVDPGHWNSLLAAFSHVEFSQIRN